MSSTNNQPAIGLGTQELVEVTRQRATVYRMLASLYFRELTQQQIEHIHNLEPFGDEGLDPLFAEGFHDMQRALRRINSGTREELAVDYAHSILGAGAYEERRATPFESVFTSEEGLLMQDARDEVLHLFKREGFLPKAEYRTPEDHLTFIFDFMAELCDRLVSELEADDAHAARGTLDTQRELHSGHLLNWIDVFCDVFDKVALTRFYRGVSKVTRGFVHMDGELMEDSVRELDELFKDSVS